MSPFLWVVLAGAVLSCFFSLVGLSLRSFRRVELEEAVEAAGGRLRLAWLDEHLSSLQLTASVCRVVCNLVLIVGVFYLLEAPAAGWWRMLAAALAAAGVLVVFGVAIPHAWSAYAGEKVIVGVLPILAVCRRVLYPVLIILQWFDVPIRRLAGVTDAEVENGDSAKQEILLAAEEGRAEGAVDPEEAEMIESVMEFGDTHAGEIMTPRTDFFALPEDTPWDQACRGIWEAGHSRVPIYEGDVDNIIGILYAKDLLEHAQRNQPARLREIMRKCYFVPETKALDDLLREFKARKVHIAVVLDEYGGTAGLVTIEDVVEEIVGEISDEYDRSEPAQIQRLAEDTVEIEGRVYIDDLNDALDIEIPEDEDYDTVAGFVFSELGYIPAVDETLERQGATFTVLDADERKINRLRVRRLPRVKDPQED